jgi:putative exosortase-associated protein (TIGR04073 family)
MTSKQILTLVISFIVLLSGSAAVFALDSYGGAAQDSSPSGRPGEVAGGSRAVEENYGERIGEKLGSGLANITTGWLEIPKTVISTTNEYNIALGITGGLFKGILHMLGRTAAGALDLITFPLPTDPVVQPQFIWEDFDRESSYKPILTSRDLRD